MDRARHPFERRCRYEASSNPRRLPRWQARSRSFTGGSSRRLQPRRGAGARPRRPQACAAAGAPQTPQPPQTGQQAALVDLTGYWVSVVNQDWRFRMMTPPKGDYAQVPLNAAARKIADQFDPARYGGANYQTSGIVDCRAYGAAGRDAHADAPAHHLGFAERAEDRDGLGSADASVAFHPGRLYGDLRAGSADEHGRQRASGPRLDAGLFGRDVGATLSINAAVWQRGPAGGAAGWEPSGQGERQPGGSLAVLTTNLTPGWLRRNGVPYSSRTRVIEHFMTFQDPTGENWFNVTTEVIDPEYLNTPVQHHRGFPEGAGRLEVGAAPVQAGRGKLIPRLRDENHANQVASSVAGGRWHQRCRTSGRSTCGGSVADQRLLASTGPPGFAQLRWWSGSGRVPWPADYGRGTKGRGDSTTRTR